MRITSGGLQGSPPLGSHILGEPSPFDPLPTPPKSPGLALLLAYPWWLDVLTGGLVSEVDFIAMELEALQAAPMAPRSPHAYFLYVLLQGTHMFSDVNQQCIISLASVARPMGGFADRCVIANDRQWRSLSRRPARTQKTCLNLTNDPPLHTLLTRPPGAWPPACASGGVRKGEGLQRFSPNALSSSLESHS